MGLQLPGHTHHLDITDRPPPMDIPGHVLMMLPVSYPLPTGETKSLLAFLLLNYCFLSSFITIFDEEISSKRYLCGIFRPKVCQWAVSLLYQTPRFLSPYGQEPQCWELWKINLAHQEDNRLWETIWKFPVKYIKIYISVCMHDYKHVLSTTKALKTNTFCCFLPI